MTYALLSTLLVQSGPEERIVNGRTTTKYPAKGRIMDAFWILCVRTLEYCAAASFRRKTSARVNVTIRRGRTASNSKSAFGRIQKPS